MKLTEGVYLHFIETKKFKTQRIKLRFSGPVDVKRLAGRVLAANILEVANKVYTTPQAFRKKLASFYGANFSTSVSKKGGVHLFDVDISFLSPSFLGGDDLTLDILDFLKISLFQPLTQADSFDDQIFYLEQKNLINYLEAETEDNFYQSNQAINQLFYQDERAQLPAMATPELVKAETPQSTFRSFQKMLEHDRIDFFFIGEFDQKMTEKLVRDFNFKSRLGNLKFNIAQDFSKITKNKVEKKEANQSILEMAYHVDVRYGSKAYYALLVLNGLLGEFSHSKLFVNIREKAGLAYTIASRLDSLTSCLKIYAGIDRLGRKTAMKLIHDQWLSLKKGQFTDKELEQTKRLIKNSARLAQDRQINLIDQVYHQEHFGEAYKDLNGWLSEIDKVSKYDVKKIANLVKLQAVYFLEGND